MTEARIIIEYNNDRSKRQSSPSDVIEAGMATEDNDEQ